MVEGKLSNARIKIYLVIGLAEALCHETFPLGLQAYTWQELVALYRLTVPASNLAALRHRAADDQRHYPTSHAALIALS